MLKLYTHMVPRNSDTSGISKISCLMLVLFSLLILTGCAAKWSPSDREALQLVKEYYLYFHEGEKIEASILKREEFVEECTCFPIIFQIIRSTAQSGEKTFYFTKNRSGDIEIKRYMQGAKHASKTTESANKI